MTRLLPRDRLPDLISALLTRQGLEPDDARVRLERMGLNDIVEPTRHSWRDVVADTARDPMLWFFAATSALYALVGQWSEATTLFAAILPLLAMDAFLHRRTQASTAGLASRLATKARALRGGKEVSIPATEVVPGDVVLVGSGEVFPADGLVIEHSRHRHDGDGADLQVDESSLTGESFPVVKHALTAVPAVPEDGLEPAVPHEHWGFAGTRLLTGRSRLAIVFTGADTVYGEIVRSARASEHAHTPLQGAVQRLVRALLSAALALCGILVFARLEQGRGWLDAFLSAVTLATAAIPEEFPVVFAFYLGVGVYRLAKRRALVRRAVTVENIGRVTCICSDKTGTMTEGSLALTSVEPALGMTVKNLLAAAAIVSRRGTGDPLDDAVHDRLDREGIRPDEIEVIARFPFTEDRKRETAIVTTSGGDRMAFTKGAAEVVLNMTTLDSHERARWTSRVTELAHAGHKVIVCAWKMDDGRGTRSAEPAHGFQFAGLLGFEDPVRPGVAEAVAICRAGGIRTIMVTGDHPLTARAVASRIGLGGGDPVVVSGDDLRAIVATDDAERLAAVDVVARATPSEKLALVRALQQRGHIVAVTGDGVNDVPALQAADIGVAMGERGTRSAREVASIVLLEDNFRTIVEAIAEGRQLFRNLQLSFKYVMTTHIPLVLTAALIPLAGYPLLYLPVHIIWLEMLIHPTALLVFQELPAGELRPIERSLRPRFFSTREWLVIMTTGIVITLLVTAGYLRSYQTGEVEHGRAMAMAVLTIASAAITAVLSGMRTRTSWYIVVATVVLGVVLIQVRPLAQRLGLTPLHSDDWLLAVAANLLTAAVLVAGELWSQRLPKRKA